MQILRKLEEKKNIALWLLVAGFGLVYLSLCFNDNIWTDEGFTLDLLRHCESFRDVCEFTAADVHPPLYYLILKVFTDLFGIRLLLIKVLSIIPMLLTMALAPLMLKKDFGYCVALLFLLTLGTLPCTMEYAVQARMYTWALFFVTLCALSAYRTVLHDKWTDWVLYLAGGVAAAYTHYFAFAAVLWIYGFLFLYFVFRRRASLFKWLAASVISLLAYLPWLAGMMRQIGGVSQSYWIVEIDGRTIRNFFPWIVDTDLPYVTAVMAVVFLLAAVLLGYRIWEGRGLDVKTAAGVFGLVIPVLVVVTGVVLSKWIRPIFIIRYILPSSGLLCLFLAVGFSYLETKAYVALALFWAGVGTLDYQMNYHKEYLATYTAQTEQFFAQHLGERDVIVYNYDIYRFIYEYYFDADKLVYIGDMDLNGDYDTIWFLDTPLNGEFAPEELAASGLQSVEMGQYGIEQNEFKIYQITRQ